ncbi:antitermination protein N [Atlantibacter subterraneus]|uniref:antitermination protein N n=1 Tax=Atlantibacter subterraneus TaxID=255519 RepID=UPI0028AB1F04|nr:antitermination protein N [Atlantibacter subterranea]
MNAQERRRERRAAKQADWKSANPLLVGISAKPDTRKILSLTRKPKSRVESAVTPIDLTVLAEYREEMEKRAEAVERKNRRTYYRDTNPFGNKIHAVQKMKLSSKPLI